MISSKVSVFCPFKNLEALASGNNKYIKLLENELLMNIELQENGVLLSGEEKNQKITEDVLSGLDFFLKKEKYLDIHTVSYFCMLAKEHRLYDFLQAESDAILITPKGRSIRGKTIGQNLYIDAVKNHEMVFCVGPAGSGKTYLSVAMAVAAFHKREVSRIILTRPAVEAGERLGFLPGDLQEKVDPYMRPIYDALQDLMGEDTFFRASERKQIEVSPLAFMRGRTLDDAFVLLDEAQNTTIEQMKMFLTRMGMNTKACICGDVTQIDLPHGSQNGLSDAASILSEIDGIRIISLRDSDIVRNPLVQRIVKAYNRGNDKGKERVEGA